MPPARLYLRHPEFKVMARETKIGCCGFPVARDKYFKNFGVVEIQSTFYHPPEDALVQRWRDEAPPEFEYTMKAWQLITHDPSSPTYKKLKMEIPSSIAKNFGSFKPTDEVFAAWERTRGVAEILKARIIVFQCPASFVPSSGNKRNLEAFFSQIKRQGLIMAWEPRGGWEESDVKAICKDLHLLHVVDPFKASRVHGGRGYFRLHGAGRSRHKYKYTEKDLSRLKTLAAKFAGSYILFNNVHMLDNSQELKRILGEVRRASARA
jgi:uncharacterized protein YecE (DUF72 family)